MHDGDDRHYATHDVVLTRGPLTLRPFLAGDLDAAVRWSADPEVVHLYDTVPGLSRSRTELAAVYQYLAATGYLFAVELDGHGVVGELTVQLLGANWAGPSNERLWRLPLAIGLPELWGHGIGGAALDLALEFAFLKLKAERLVAMEVAGFNVRAHRLFTRRGFSVWRTRINAFVRNGARFPAYDYSLSKAAWIVALNRRTAPSPHPEVPAARPPGELAALPQTPVGATSSSGELPVPGLP